MTSTEFSVGATDRANKILAFDGNGEISVTQELGTFVGNWSASRDYNARDIVKDTSTNNIFICNTSHTSSGSEPLTTNTDSAKWDLLVDASSATTSATNAASSATAAASSATAAASSATSASTQASNASSSATAAASSATAAASSATDAANSADAFDDVYLGSKSSDPTTDNDGDALAAGMLYYNTTSNIMRVYSGSAWENVAVSTSGFATLAGVETLTNKTLTSPKIGTKISDTNGNELLNLTATSSAVNELTFANAATGNNPSFTASGGDTNVGINLVPKGTGVVQANGSAIKVAGKETIWVPAVAMYPNSTNGCADLAQVELSNGPEIKTLDFDKDSDEFAQFAVAFPKSWNEGTITFQAYFTADSTDTGTVSWGLSGVAIADNDSVNTAFGTQVAPTAKAHSGTANDLDVTAESGAVTIAGSPSTDEEVFFQISRDVSEDSLTADAKLLGIKLFFTTDAANDT
tara:strand:- start:562 stop:1962 length:1401 start_codon:yes stop_codon:yes gene_type:complete